MPYITLETGERVKKYIDHIKRRYNRSDTMLESDLQDIDTHELFPSTENVNQPTQPVQSCNTHVSDGLMELSTEYQSTTVTPVENMKSLVLTRQNQMCKTPVY